MFTRLRLEKIEEMSNNSRVQVEKCPHTNSVLPLLTCQGPQVVLAPCTNAAGPLAIGRCQDTTQQKLAMTPQGVPIRCLVNPATAHFLQPEALQRWAA